MGSGNPLIDGTSTSSTSSSAKDTSSDNGQAQATSALKKADKAMAEVGKEARQVSKDTSAVEDALWAKMQGKTGHLQEASSTLKNDADNLDIYSLEGKAKKYAAQAADALSSFGLGEASPSPMDVQDAAKAAKEEQTTARKQTVEMADAYNKVKADAGEISTLNLKGMDASNLPSDVKKDVALLNELRLDAAAVSKGEKQAVDTDVQVEQLNE